MADTLKEKEEEVFKRIEAAQLLDVQKLKKGVRLIQESEFLREYMKPNRTSRAMVRAAKQLDKELQKLSGKKHIFLSEGVGSGGGDPGSGPRSGGIDTGAAEQYAAGCALAAAVAGMIPGGQPIAAGFILAGAIAGAVAVFGKAQ